MATQAQLDAMARQAGFPDYATWAAYQQKRMAMQHGPAPAGSGGGAPNNWLQNLAEHIPLHPAMLFRYVSDKINGATGQK
jgi:hypothetical protein